MEQNVQKRKIVHIFDVSLFKPTKKNEKTNDNYHRASNSDGDIYACC